MVDIQMEGPAGPVGVDAKAIFGPLLCWLDCPWCSMPDAVPVAGEGFVTLAQGEAIQLVQECPDCRCSVEVMAIEQEPIRDEGRRWLATCRRFGADLREQTEALSLEAVLRDLFGF